MNRRTTHIVLATAALAALGAVAATLVVARRLAEPTVVPDPYEAGLHYGDPHAAARPAGERAQAGPRGQPEESPPPCDVTHGRCARVLKGGVSVVLEVTPSPPRAMTELAFVADVLYGGLPMGGAALDLDLTMPGMSMGPNRVHLAPDGQGRFRGRGTVVRCPSGRRRWEAELTVAPDRPGAAMKPLRATFTFDVAE